MREHHSHGESWHAPGLPDAVVFPTSTEEVAAIVKLCAEQRKPMVAFGMGSSLEGHVNAIHGGVSIDLTRMTRVLRLSPEDLDITVEAGLTRLKLDAHLKNTGLMFPIDPGADATIGGMAATRASGTTAVRYGTMRENVLGLTVVLADGRIIKTGGRARKSSSGYDLTRLFVGSEGTLGVITEVTLRLVRPSRSGARRGLPVRIDGRRGEHRDPDDPAWHPGRAHRNHRRSAAARRQRLFEDQLSAGADVVLRVPRHQRGVGRGSDSRGRRDRARARRQGLQVGGVARRSQHPLAGAPQRVLRDGGVAARRAGVDHGHLRADLAPGRMHPRDAGRICGEANVVAPLVGHAGDGNFHLIIMLDPDDRQEFETISRLSERLVERAMRFGGTCSGEHGVGIGKLKYLQPEHGEALDVMRAIKRAIDPNNLMNPGKLIPEV